MGTNIITAAAAPVQSNAWQTAGAGLSGIGQLLSSAWGAYNADKAAKAQALASRDAGLTQNTSADIVPTVVPQAKPTGPALVSGPISRGQMQPVAPMGTQANPFRESVTVTPEMPRFSDSAEVSGVGGALFPAVQPMATSLSPRQPQLVAGGAWGGRGGLGSIMAGRFPQLFPSTHSQYGGL